MNEGADFRRHVQQIGDLVQKIETIADPAVRAETKALVQSLMSLHGGALERALEIVAGGGDAGMKLIDQMGRDPLVSSLLVLYGLHPEEMETRVVQAIERVKPQLQKQGCEVELLGMNEGVVRLRIDPGSHTCGSTAKTAQALVEGAIYDAAPDIAGVTIEGLAGKAATGFVALDALAGSMVRTADRPVAVEGTD